LTLSRDWQKKGHTLSYTDVTIASVALSNGVPLLTDNGKHFPICPSYIFILSPTGPTLSLFIWDKNGVEMAHPSAAIY
jgi:hypothetical protein